VKNSKSLPLDSIFLVNPKAHYMARLHNRISIASINSENAHDVKAVYYSYRGWIPALNTTEIPGFMYPDPMLVFPYTNKYYCDADDIDDKITAHVAFGDMFITFTGHCTFMWQEGMADPVKVSDDVGCISSHSVAEFEGKLIWLSNNGIYTFSGSKVENISYEKMEPYIQSLNNDGAYFCSAVIYDRKYFITGPFNGGSTNDLVLVYDFDLKEWHTRTFKNSSGATLTVDHLATYHDGERERLYAAVKTSAAACSITEMETGYTDDGTAITVALKSKYFDFKAPDVRKSVRNLYIDVENYAAEGLTTSVYIDNLNAAAYSFTHTNNTDGFILNSTTAGLLNSDALKNLSDELLGFSLPRGSVGSRFQLGFSVTGRGAPVRIHALEFDWRAKGRVGRKYGG